MPHHHYPITYFVMFFVELELVSFLKISSCCPINNIVVVNTTKSKNNHTKNTCMISTLHYFCSPPPAHIESKLVLPLPTTQQHNHNHNHNHNPYCHYAPLCLSAHPLTKAPNKYTSSNLFYGIKKSISYQKSPKYLPTTSQII